MSWTFFLTIWLLLQSSERGWAGIALTAILAIVVNLLIVAFGYGRFASKVDTLQLEFAKMSESMEAKIKSVESDLTHHRERTDRHTDPDRDGKIFEQLLSRLGTIESRFDRLETKIDNLGGTRR